MFWKIVLILMLPRLVAAQGSQTLRSSVTSRSNIYSMEDGWSGRLKSVVNSSFTDDEDRAYRGNSEFRVRKKIVGSWSAVAGIQLSQNSSQENGTQSGWDELSLGIKKSFRLLNTKHSSKVLYHYYPEAERRLQEMGNAYIESEVKATYRLRKLGMRSKYKYMHYFRSQREDGMTIGRFQGQFFPGYHKGSFSLGIFNELDHRYNEGRDSQRYSVGSFVRYKGKSIRPLLIVSYSPFNSGDGGWVNGWSSEPKFSLEFDIIF